MSGFLKEQSAKVHTAFLSFLLLQDTLSSINSLQAFCPSCHAKRSVAFSEWVCNEVLDPVTHRHYVFSIPKILRIYFRYNRKLLGGLSRCASETVREMMQAAGLPLRDSNATGSGDNAAVPGMIAAIQTFGSDIDWPPSTA